MVNKEEAVTEFKKKFRLKTKNSFGERFVPQPGKYSLVEVRDSAS
jgi:hypothetical protein